MTSIPLVDFAPRFTVSAAARLARTGFGVDGRATELTSDRDQNFLIEGSPPASTRIVLKIANARESRELLEAQQAVLRRLAARVAMTPQIVPGVDGASIVEAVGEDGTRHLAWAISWLDGEPMATLRRQSPELLEELGVHAGSIDRALADFDHPALHRDFHWDLAHGRAIVRASLDAIADRTLHDAVETLMQAFDRYTAPRLDALPRSAIHGDLNHHNVLVDVERSDGDGAAPTAHIAGIVDYGDVIHSYRVGDLAIGCAYVMLDADDPLSAASHVVRGFTRQLALGDDEFAALFGLIVLRLATSACIAVEQQRRRPDNEYLGVSQPAIGRLLPELANIPFGYAEAVFRKAAGKSATRNGARVVEYLRGLADFAAVLPIDVRREPSMVLDLGIASPLIDGDPAKNAEPSFTARIDAAMRDAGVRVAIGRYDEPRLIYVAPAFATGDRVIDEHRTVHMGLDLFADAGMPVFAPLAGTVHAFADNAAPQDYGPVVVLRHTTDDGVEFFTLYGHLSRESLHGLAVGAHVRAGQRIATLGAPNVNGGWTPHLHLQVIADLLGLDTDFPGVARPTQRDVWLELCPDPNLLVGVPAANFPPPAPSVREALERRREWIGRNLSIAYREPVRAVRGWMQFLYDDTGRRYLDAYNNVPHVGHCHPRVVEAGAAQMHVLNTNTRYVNDRLAEYAERLAATLPDGLDVCYFTSSASEANELALRLTRAYTGARDMIVLDAGYHGNTTTLIDLSPYKHAGPGGMGAPDWVHVVPVADDYRGEFTRGDPQAGAKYAATVATIVDRLQPAGKRLAGFLAETCPSVGGQIVFPPGYLSNVYEHVRKAGGVCIADEVQTGLGRMGTSFWAFEDQGVVPDIVVMGKPLGNGHPVGAVVTTRAIADAFDNGMEYFATFGGNTVSCAIGLAVLDVVRDEQLQAHARRVGEQMTRGFRELATRHPIIGDVRGSGLFFGLELVRDRGTLKPATAEAKQVANLMRERGVLLGTDGPYDNVIKIRPPMPFSGSDADVVLEELDRALGVVAPQ